MIRWDEALPRVGKVAREEFRRLGALGRMGRAVNGGQSARLEELTRLARASTVKVRPNERKKDSDRAALEEE